MNDKKIFFPNIERLRGFACLLVFVQHMIWICPLKFLTTILPSYLWVGKQGASIFFIISGFVITLSLNRIFADVSGEDFLARFLSIKDQLFQFLKRRIFRIFPVIIVSLLILAAYLSCSEPNYNWAAPLFQAPFEILFGIFNMSVEHFVESKCIYTKGAGPLWTVAVEIAFYIWWPITLLLFKKQNSRILLTLALTAGFMFIIQPISISFFGYQYYSTHQNLSELFSGSLIAYLYLSNSQKWELKVSNPLKYLISFVMCLFFWMYLEGIYGNVFSSKIAITSSCVVFLLLAITDSFSIPFLNGVFDFFGKRSYSFYVIQLTLANLIVSYTNSEYFPKNLLSIDEFYLYQFLIYLLLLLIVTELLYRLIEVPSRKIGTKI